MKLTMFKYFSEPLWTGRGFDRRVQSRNGSLEAGTNTINFFAVTEWSINYGI